MLSVPHLIVIFLVALVVLGPEKLPEVARVLGKIMAEFRKVSTDFRTTLEDEMREIDRHLREKERLAKEAAAAAPAQPAMLVLPEVESEAPTLPQVAGNDAPATPPVPAEAATSESPAQPPIIPDPDARHINPEATPALVAEPAPSAEPSAPETPSERAMTES